MDKDKVTRGPNKEFPVRKQIRMTEQDAEKLKSLAEQLQSDESKVVRGLIREAEGGIK